MTFMRRIGAVEVKREVDAYMNIELPKDADGLEIPLDVDALYDKNGGRVAVSRWNYTRGRNNSWTFNLLFEYPDVPHYPQDFHLSKPDSWESLEQDARKAPRDYIEGRGIAAGKDGRVTAMAQDIVRRAKELAGVRNEG